MRGVFQNNSSLEGWTLSSATGYYLLLILAPALLMAHPEIPVLRDDIERGELAGRLLKPLSYYWQRFFHEIPYRLFQGGCGVIIYIVLTFYLGNFIEINFTLPKIGLIAILVILAYFIAFTFKMIVAIVAFWTTDIRGLHELIEVLIVIFGGFIVPINLLPSLLEKIANILPFSYIIYYPIIAIQGSLSLDSLLKIIGIQLIWLVTLIILFKLTWKKAIRAFTDLAH
jgi:ABC-2 type transport system permease protein